MTEYTLESTSADASVKNSMVFMHVVASSRLQNHGYISSCSRSYNGLVLFFQTELIRTKTGRDERAWMK